MYNEIIHRNIQLAYNHIKEASVLNGYPIERDADFWSVYNYLDYIRLNGCENPDGPEGTEIQTKAMALRKKILEGIENA